MKKIYLLLFIFGTVNVALGQNNRFEGLSIPSLKQKMDSTKDGVNKVQLQLALGKEILLKAGSGSKDIDSSMYLAARAARLSRQFNYPEGIVNSMLLNALCFNRKQDERKGYKIALQALGYAKKVNFSLGMAESYIAIGQHFPITGTKDLRTRMDYYSKAIQIFRKVPQLHRLASTLESQAELHFLAHQRTEAIKLLFEALSVNKAIGNKRVHGIYWLIGRTSINMGDFPNALKYHLLALKTGKKLNDTTLLMCSIYHTMAGVHTSMSKHREAIPYSEMALKIARHYNEGEYILVTSALLATEYTETNNAAKGIALLKSVKKYADGEPEKLFVSSILLSNLSHARQFPKAEIYAQEVIGLLRKMPPENHVRFLYAFSYLAYYYMDTRQYQKASLYADKYAKLVEKSGIPSGIRENERLYYKLDSIKADFKASMKHYLNAQRIKDSMDNVTKAYQISLLQIENDTEKKNNDIDSLNKQAQVKDGILKRNQTIQQLIIAGFLVLLIITGLIYSRYRLKQRSNKLLLRQKSEIDIQNNALQQLVHEKNDLIGDKDNLLFEKELLFKEVNHRVKNNLQIIMSLLQSQSGYLQNENAQKAIMESQNRVQSIALIHNQLFQTDKVAEIDLASYVAQLVQSLDFSMNTDDQKVKIDSDVDKIILDVSQAVPVGIILNEAVTNALKYAFPDNRPGVISVSVKQEGDFIALKVRDNGVGLPSNFSLSEMDSLGISLIKGLARQVKGTFAIENDSGVTILVTFPRKSPI